MGRPTGTLSRDELKVLADEVAAALQPVKGQMLRPNSISIIVKKDHVRIGAGRGGGSLPYGNACLEALCEAFEGYWTQSGYGVHAIIVIDRKHTHGILSLDRLIDLGEA